MDQRVHFIIADCQRDVFDVADLAWRVGISRKTTYKWLERYEVAGPSGLIDRSRRPAQSPERDARGRCGGAHPAAHCAARPPQLRAVRRARLSLRHRHPRHARDVVRARDVVSPNAHETLRTGGLTLLPGRSSAFSVRCLC